MPLFLMLCPASELAILNASRGDWTSCHSVKDPGWWLVDRWGTLAVLCLFHMCSSKGTSSPFLTSTGRILTGFLVVSPTFIIAHEKYCAIIGDETSFNDNVHAWCLKRFVCVR